MVHWIFILVGFAFGFFFGATAIMFINQRKRKEERKGLLRLGFRLPEE